MRQTCGAARNAGVRHGLRLGRQRCCRIETIHSGIARYLALFDAMPEVLSADRVTGAVTTSQVLSNPDRKDVTVRVARVPK